MLLTEDVFSSDLFRPPTPTPSLLQPSTTSVSPGESILHTCPALQASKGRIEQLEQIRYSENPHHKKNRDEKSETKFMLSRIPQRHNISLNPFSASHCLPIAPIVSFPCFRAVLFLRYATNRFGPDYFPCAFLSPFLPLPLPQYYGPMGKDWIFDNNGLNGAGPLGPP